MPGDVPYTPPPATPCTTRATSSHPNVGASPASANASALSARPAAKTRPWPMRSATAPATNEVMA